MMKEKPLWIPTRPVRAIVGIGLLLLIALHSPITGAWDQPLWAADFAQGAEPSDASVIQRIRERDNTLVAGIQYDFSPYEFIGEDGQAAGFHVALIRAMAEKWGVDVEFVPVTPSDRLQKLQAGRVDIVPLEEGAIDLSIDGSFLSLSHFYWQDQIGILVRSDSDVLSEDFVALNGKNVAVVTGSGVEKSLTAGGFNSGSTSPVSLPFREYGPAVSALRASQVDATLGPEHFLARAAAQYPELITIALTNTVKTEMQERFALGTSRRDPYFRGLVDSTLQGVWIDGTIATLSLRWFGDVANRDLASMHVGEWPYTFADSPVAVLHEDVALNEAGIETILQRQRLVVGIPYDLSPFGFVSDEGFAVGFGADLAYSLAERWFGGSEMVELVPVTAQTRLPLLATGAVDLVIAPTTPNWSDEAVVDFSKPFMWDRQSLLVRGTALLQTFEDLEGQSLAVVSGSRASTLIRTQAEALEVQVSLLPFQEYSSAFQSLRAGQVVAIAGPSSALKLVALEDDTLDAVDLGLADEPYSIGLENGNGYLRVMVDASLLEMETDGTLDGLYRKWFGDDLSVVSRGAIGTGESISNSLESDRQLSTVAATNIARPTSTPTLVLTQTPTPIPTQRPAGTAVIVLASPVVATATPTRTATQIAAQTSISTAVPIATPIEVATVVTRASPTPPLRVHIVKDGDSLTSLATEYYGLQSFFQLIYDTNRTVIGDDPNFLIVGTQLVIPPTP